VSTAARTPLTQRHSGIWITIGYQFRAVPLARLDCGRPSLNGLSVMTRLLTADEVAERLGVTKDWVWAQARAGRIPHVQLGRYRRFREEALEDWLVELGAKRRKEPWWDLKGSR
jgi:excisionase family DNA binding protein